MGLCYLTWFAITAIIGFGACITVCMCLLLRNPAAAPRPMQWRLDARMMASDAPAQDNTEYIPLTKASVHV